jgi:hypothetical protein
MSSMIGNNPDRFDEFMIVSDLAQKLGSAVFHLMKEADGYQRSEGLGDEEITSYREYLADVFAELKRMVEGRGDGRLKSGQDRVIPFSIPLRLAEVWSVDIDENMEKLDLVVGRLKDPDNRLLNKDMRFVKLIFEVISNISTEIYQSRLRDNPTLPFQ